MYTPTEMTDLHKSKKNLQHISEYNIACNNALCNNVALCYENRKFCGVST